MLTELRKKIAALERPAGLAESGVQPLGIPLIDAVLEGGLARGALHEIAAVNPVHITAATGFALGVSLLLRRKSIVWIAEDTTLTKNGMPCGAGLDEFGLTPERLIIVAANRMRNLLWAMEEALRCRAVGAVIGEMRRETIDPIALRRLSLAASEHGGLALVLRAAPSNEISTAATRWVVGAANSRASHGPGPPRISAQLVRNRRGPLGSWTLEWSGSDERFVPASTHPQSVALPTVNRPARAVA
jgi:protein ImuA